MATKEYNPGTWGEIFYSLKKKSILPTNGIYLDHVVEIVTSKVFKKKKLSCTETDWVNAFANKFNKEAKRQNRLSNSHIQRDRSDQVNFFLDKKIDLDFEECPHDPKCDHEDEKMEVDENKPDSPGQSNSLNFLILSQRGYEHT